jgi:exonuclease III
MNMKVLGEAQRAPRHSKHSLPEGNQCVTVNGKQVKPTRSDIHARKDNTAKPMRSDIHARKDNQYQRKAFFQNLGKRKKARLLRRKAEARVARRSQQRDIGGSDETEGNWCTNLILKSNICWIEFLLVVTWNVRTMITRAAQQLVFSDMHRLKIAAAALQECRWEKHEVAKKVDGYVCYGGGAWKNSRGALIGGAVVAIHSSIANAVRKHEHRIGRIQLVQIEGKFGVNFIIGCLYYPTESDSEQEKNKFWRELKEALASIGYKRRDILILGGDMNGETGKSDLGEESESPIGRWGGGNQNQCGKRLIQECQLEQWFLPATFINRPFRNKWTFTGNFLVKKDSEAKRRREYDHFICSNNLKGRVEDVINVRNTLHDSDHCLRYARINLKKLGIKTNKKMLPVTGALRSKACARKIEIQVRNRFKPLIDLEENEFKDLSHEDYVPELWDKLKLEVHGIAALQKSPMIKRDP